MAAVKWQYMDMSVFNLIGNSVLFSNAKVRSPPNLHNPY